MFECFVDHDSRSASERTNHCGACAIDVLVRPIWPAGRHPWCAGRGSSSCGLAMVVVEHAPQPLTTYNAAAGGCVIVRGDDGRTWQSDALTAIQDALNETDPAPTTTASQQQPVDVQTANERQALSELALWLDHMPGQRQGRPSPHRQPRHARQHGREQGQSSEPAADRGHLRARHRVCDHHRRRVQGLHVRHVWYAIDQLRARRRMQPHLDVPERLSAGRRLPREVPVHAGRALVRRGTRRAGRALHQGELQDLPDPLSFRARRVGRSLPLSC